MSVMIGSMVASLVTVGRMLALCVVGLCFARYRMGAEGAAAWKVVARLNAEFITPCLCFGAITKGIDAEAFRELWPVALLAIVLPCLWLGVGALGGWFFFSKDQRHYVTFSALTVAYPNSFAIPYSLLLGLRHHVSWIQEHRRGEEFMVTVCMLFATIELLQIWTVAFYFYGRAARDAVKGEGIAAATAATSEEASAEVVAVKSDAEAGPERKECLEETSAVPQPFLPRHIGLCVGLREMFNPLVLSLIAAMVLALTPLRQPLVDSFVHEVFQFVGAASVPLVLLQMGAGMARPPSDMLRSRALQMRTAILITIFRLLVGNVCGAAVVTAFRRAGYLTDPLMTLSLYLMCSAPTAANLMLVSSVQGGYVQPTSVLLFCMQLAAVPVITISVSIFVAILS